MPKKRIAGIILMVLELIAVIYSLVTAGQLPEDVVRVFYGEGVIWTAVGYFLPGIIGLILFVKSFEKNDK